MKSRCDIDPMDIWALKTTVPWSKSPGHGRHFGIGTMDTTAKGVRCQAAQDIPVSGGFIKSLALGTIVFELVGRGCHLVNVYWDQGIDTLVSPTVIVVAETGIVWH